MRRYSPAPPAAQKVTLQPTSKCQLLRKSANEEMERENFQNSLVLLNRSLLECDMRKSEAALCYGNRATVYKLNDYNSCCLESIRLAEGYYPFELKQKLLDMKELCLDPEAQDKHEEFPNTFDQLSHPASFSLPFFVDGIEMSEEEDSGHDGRYLIAAHDFKAGDIIAVIDLELQQGHASHLIEPSNRAWGCYNCLKVNNLNLRLADGCPGGELKLH